MLRHHANKTLLTPISPLGVNHTQDYLYYEPNFVEHARPVPAPLPVDLRDFVVYAIAINSTRLLASFLSSAPPRPIPWPAGHLPLRNQCTLTDNCNVLF
jgi:hypothetical protein